MNAIVPFRANDVHLNLIDASAGARAQPPPAHKGMAYSRSEGPLKEERRPSNAFNSHAAAICRYKRRGGAKQRRKVRDEQMTNN